MVTEISPASFATQCGARIELPLPIHSPLSGLPSVSLLPQAYDDWLKRVKSNTDVSRLDPEDIEGSALEEARFEHDKLCWHAELENLVPALTFN